MSKYADFSKVLVVWVRHLGSVGTSLSTPSPSTTGQTVHDARRNQYTWQGSWIPTAYVQHIRHKHPFDHIGANFVQGTTYTDSYAFTVPYHCNIEYQCRFAWESPKWTTGTSQAYSAMTWSQTLDNAEAQGDTVYSTGRNSASGTGETDADRLSITALAWFKDVAPGSHTVRIAISWFGWGSGFTSNGGIMTGRSRVRFYPNGLLYNCVAKTNT